MTSKIQVIFPLVRRVGNLVLLAAGLVFPGALPRLLVGRSRLWRNVLMLQLDPAIPFEPSPTTKGLWKFVRHSSAQAGRLTLPGLFGLSLFPIDLSGFFLVLVLEAWGLYNLFLVGQIQPVYVLGLFLLDLLFAFLAHFPKGRVCLNENRLLYADDAMARERLRTQNSRRRMLSRVFAVGIVAVALFKILSFLSLQRILDGLTLSIAVSYLVAALLHITCTGSFLFAIFAQLLLWRDRSRFRNAPATDPVLKVQGRRSFHFTSLTKLQEFAVANHDLKSVNSDDNLYLLSTAGILQDSEVHAFCMKQVTTEAQDAVAANCVRAQVQIMEQELVPPPAETRAESHEGETPPEEASYGGLRSVAPARPGASGD